MESIQQLCEFIAKHPSHINDLNKVVALTLTYQDSQLMVPVLKLIERMPKEPKLQEFVENKLHAMFAALIIRQDPGSMEVLQKCYALSGRKSKMALEFLENDQKGKVEWDAGWPGELLCQALELLSASIENNSKTVNWETVTRALLNLPEFSQLEIPQNLESNFKANYQKLLLSTLACPECPEPYLMKIYQQLNMKLLSKMSQPLALSNFCLSKFGQYPQMQICMLSCLFILVGKYGLELEEFYPKLEILIKYRENTKSVYELPNSKKFFKLLEAALRSSRVPFKTVHNFVEIIVKQIAGQRGQFAFWSLSFIINLSKKHRKLMDYLPHLPEIRALKNHYNKKVRALVSELFKNLNKIDFLELEDFTKLSLKPIAQKKIESAMNSLQNDQLQFKVPLYYEQI